MKLIEIPEPNDPFENHWSDPSKLGFNRGLKPKQIHEIFRDADEQSKIEYNSFFFVLYLYRDKRYIYYGAGALKIYFDFKIIGNFLRNHENFGDMGTEINFRLKNHKRLHAKAFEIKS